MPALFAQAAAADQRKSQGDYKMATNILASTEYTISKNDRQALLASIHQKLNTHLELCHFQF